MKKIKHKYFSGNAKTSKIRKNDLKKSIFWMLPIYSIFFLTVGVEYSDLFPTHRDGNLLNIILQVRLCHSQARNLPTKTP